MMNKAIAAFILAGLTIIELWTGWGAPGITEEWIITVLALLTPIIVWLVPNWPARTL